MRNNSDFLDMLFKSKQLKDYYRDDYGYIYNTKKHEQIGKITFYSRHENNKFDAILEPHKKQYHKIFLGIARAIEKLQGQKVVLITEYSLKTNRGTKKDGRKK